jgi:hypothetical protein
MMEYEREKEQFRIMNEELRIKIKDGIFITLLTFLILDLFVLAFSVSRLTSDVSLLTALFNI